MTEGNGVLVAESGEAQERRGKAGAEQELSRHEYLQICQEISEQPRWREEADRACEYVDGNQIDSDTLDELKRRGMGPLHVNMIQSLVNNVLGTEAKQRTDWRVDSDNDEWSEVAEAMSLKLAEAERKSRADRGCSDAYASQIKAGVGWIEVSRVADPFKYKYRANAVHRREMYWDWFANDPGLDDARYTVRRRWYDLDQVKTYFPEQAELIEAAGLGWPAEWIDRAKTSIDLAHGFEQERDITLTDLEWRNSGRRRVCIFEVGYRRYVRGYVIRIGERAVELNMANPMHQLAVARGAVKPEMAVYSKTRSSFWVGPHKLADTEDRPRYIPFWGYKEDMTGVPYGIVRAMMSPQDEFNARRQKLMWLLSAKRVTMDEDALSAEYGDVERMLNEIARPDAVVILNKARANRDAFRVDDNLNLSNQQFEVMMEAKQAIQEAAGMFNSMLGRSDGVRTGVAIDSLVEQGFTVLAEINDNYRHARRLTGEALLRLVVEDLTGKPVQVMVGEGKGKRVIVLNEPTVDPETGIAYLKNDVSKAQLAVDLEDVPSTPSYRKQQLVMLTEAMKGMAPELQAVMAPTWIEYTDIQNRKQIAEQMRRVLNVPQPANDEEAKAMEQAQAEQAAKAAALQEQAAMLELQGKQLANEKMAREIELMGQEAAPPPGVDPAEVEARIMEITRQRDEAVMKLTGALQEERAAAAERLISLQQQLVELTAKRNDAQEAARLAAIAEVRKAELDAEARTKEAEATVKAAEAAKPEPEVRDDAPILKAIEGLGKMIEKLAERVEKVEAGEKESEKKEPEPAAAPEIHVHLDGSGKVTKTIKLDGIQRGKDGKVSGATATVEERPEG